MTTQNEATNPTAASNLIAEKTPLEDAKAKLLEQLNAEDIQEEEREQLMAEIALMSSQISDIDKRLDKAQKEREKSEKKAQTEAQAKLSCETGEAKALMEAVRADIQTKSNFSGLLIAAAAACYNIQGFYMVFAQVEAEYKAAEEPVPAVIRKNKSLIKWGFENDELFFKSGQKQGTLRGISQIEKAKKSKTAPKEEGEEQTGSAGRASGSNGGESKTTDGIEIPKSLLGIVGRFETIKRKIDEAVNTAIEEASPESAFALLGQWANQLEAIVDAGPVNDTEMAEILEEVTAPELCDVAEG